MARVNLAYPAYRYEHVKCLAVSLPDDIEALRASGDFAGEVQAIEERLHSPVFPEALYHRLHWEKVIASDMTRDYGIDREELLAVLREAYPTLDGAGLDRVLATGHADYILRDGERRYQNDAPANLLQCCENLLRTLTGQDPLPIAGTHHAVIREMQRDGKASRFFRVRLSIRPDETIPSLCRELEGQELTVHLPIPASVPTQSQIRIIRTSHPAVISDAAQRTVCMKAPFVPGEDFSVEFSFVNTAPYCAPDPARADGWQSTFYCGEEYPHIRFTPYLRELAEAVAGEEKNPLLLARRVYDYITKNVRYSYMRAYLNIPNIPEFVAHNGRGDCGAQALLFITLCRILKIPARWQSGYGMRDSGLGHHDWAMFYVAPYGWMYADLSRGGEAAEEGDLLTWNHYFGNIEPYRMATCSEFQREFEPAKRHMRADPYDNQKGEIETADRGLWSFETVDAHELLECRKM